MLSNKKIYWTQHSKSKMRQYGLSKSKLMNLLYKPHRKELGIVPGTVALMRANKDYSNKQKKALLPKSYKNMRKSPGEVWLMYKDVNSRREGYLRKIISAWRYPGISKPGEAADIIIKYSD